MTVSDDTPPLRFRLLGSWHAVLLNELESRDLVSEFVASVVGKRDIDATLRARMRQDLTTAIATAQAGHARAMFIATEVVPGLPMPVTLTVYSPPRMHMSPAVGTSPETVMAVLKKSFAATGMAHLGTARESSIPGSRILRLHHVDDHDLPEQPELHTRTLTADYWYTVPGSKQVVVATFSTPMGDIPNLMLDYFDAVVRASYWDERQA